ncbi:MAG: AraC family transcriptional regulator [Clostridium sp.]|nr:AraC family transcriptional regulator [Clostridium sp.]
MSDNFFLLKPDTLLHITYIGRHVTPERWNHFSRTVGEHILYAVYEGQMFIREEGVDYRLAKGDLFFLEAGKSHTGYRPSSCSYYYVHFPPIPQLTVTSGSPQWQREQVQNILQMNYNASSLSDQFYSQLELLFPKYFHVDQASVFNRILTSLQTALQCRQAKRPYYKTAESCCIMELLYNLSRAWMDSVFSRSQMDISSPVYEKTDQLLNYLHTYYHTKISGSGIEEQFSMNFDYLNRIFKKRTQSTIFAYLNNIRMEQAKQLLLTTHLPIHEIASRTGFSDEYYFSRAFKKALSISPAKFRKNRI